MSAPAQLPFEQTHPLQLPPQLRTLQSQGALHARRRSLLQPHFSPKHMRELRPRVDVLVARLLEELAEQGPPADLHEALALPLPILVICELLGVPCEDRDKLRGWIDDASNSRDRAQYEQGLCELLDYGQWLVTSKRRDPGYDVISQLCSIEGISDAEAIWLSMALLFSGHETTTAQIDLGVLRLLTNPDQWQTLLDDPRLIDNAVEEILRVFPTPDRVDVTCSAAACLSSGHDALCCIDAPLARIELQAVFTQLVPRFPMMRLAVYVDELRTRRDVLAGGLIELPVWW